jgi:hypothetical protein
MADVLGLAASIVTFIQFADRLVTLAKNAYDTYQDGAADIRRVLIEVTTMRSLVENLQPMVEQNASSINQALISKLLLDCVSSIQALDAELDKLRPSRLDQSTPLIGKAKKAIAATTFIWTGKPSEVKRYLKSLERNKSALILAMAGDTS